MRSILFAAVLAAGISALTAGGCFQATAPEQINIGVRMSVTDEVRDLYSKNLLTDEEYSRIKARAQKYEDQRRAEKKAKDDD